jgi:hypothetical protein
MTSRRQSDIKKDTDPEGYLVSVQDIHNAVREHLCALDELWPDAEPFGKPRKVQVVELIDGIKLRLIQRADANMNRYISPFEKAAGKLLGPSPSRTMPLDTPPAATPEGKTAMQTAMEDARARISRNSR